MVSNTFNMIYDQVQEALELKEDQERGLASRRRNKKIGFLNPKASLETYNDKKLMIAKRYKALGWLRGLRLGSLIDLAFDSVALRKPSKFMYKWYTFV
ncbi:hypothetical protein GQ457_17G010590 [Hibiscus cannabinus]